MSKRDDSNNHERDTQPTRRVPVQRDSVAYRTQRDMAQTTKITGGSAKAVVGRRAPKRAHYAVFLVTTVFVGIIAAVLIFTMMFNEIFSSDGLGGGQSHANVNPPDITEQNLPPANPDGGVTTPTPAEINLIGIVQEVNRGANRIDVYVIAEGRLRSFFVESHSVLRDRFGTAMTLAGINPGNVVEITYTQNAVTSIETARVSASVLSHNNIHDVIIEAENQVLRIGARRYNFSPFTIVRYHGAAVDITDIDPVDVVSVDIFNNKVVLVEIHRGNGIIHIPPGGGIIQGVVEIGTSAHTLLDNDGDGMDIRVAEGDHRVVIRGANIEPFVYEVVVERGGVSYVNLDGVELRAGSLVVSIEDPLAVLTINGEVFPTNSPILLEHGTYTIVVERDGFESFSQEITIGSEGLEISVRLAEIVRSRNIVIQTRPAGARVYLDDEYIGISPVGVYLELRRYNVRFTMPGFVPTPNIQIWITETTENPISFPLVIDPNAPSGF